MMLKKCPDSAGAKYSAPTAFCLSIVYCHCYLRRSRVCTVSWLTPVSRRRGSAARLEWEGDGVLSRSSASLRNGLQRHRASRRFFAAVRRFLPGDCCRTAILRFATGYRDIAPRGAFSRLSGDFCLGIAVAQLYFAPQRVIKTSPFQGFFAGCSRGAAAKRSRKMGWGHLSPQAARHLRGACMWLPIRCCYAVL